MISINSEGGDGFRPWRILLARVLAKFISGLAQGLRELVSILRFVRDYTLRQWITNYLRLSRRAPRIHTNFPPPSADTSIPTLTTAEEHERYTEYGFITSDLSWWGIAHTQLVYQPFRQWRIIQHQKSRNRYWKVSSWVSAQAKATTWQGGRSEPVALARGTGLQGLSSLLAMRHDIEVVLLECGATVFSMQCDFLELHRVGIRVAPI